MLPARAVPGVSRLQPWLTRVARRGIGLQEVVSNLLIEHVEVRTEKASRSRPHPALLVARAASALPMC